MTKYYYIYIITNKYHGTLYVGITNNLIKRIWEHKNKFVKGFTEKHDLHKLVYFEIHQDAIAAIQREKILKKWRRAWKIRLIERKNPTWDDLYQNILG